MPNHDYQRHSFLGGEVSPSLYERVDMEKFGKWFAKAENIRFRETGAFRNRNGFSKIANTKFNQSGQIIKLLSFSFNDEESFLVELGPGYARFFRNGQPIMSGDEPYEIPTAFSNFSDVDIKYAQAGDTIFLTHPTYGIYQLARLRSDGALWEFKKFEASILPMKEENDDESNTMTLSTYSGTIQKLSISNTVSSEYEDISFTLGTDPAITLDSGTKNDIYDFIRTSLEADYDVTLEGDYLLISAKDPNATVPSASISYKCVWITQETATQSFTQGTQGGQLAVTIAVPSAWDYLDSVTTYYESGMRAVYGGAAVTKTYSKDITAADIDSSLLLARGVGEFSQTYYNRFVVYEFEHSSEGITIDIDNDELSYECSAILTNVTPPRNVTDGTVSITINGRMINKAAVSNSSIAISADSSYYTLASTKDVFDKLNIDDCVLVRHYIDAQTLSGNYSTGTHTLGPVKSDGNWRSYNLGNWAGKVQIQYSVDNGTTWVDYYSWTSEDDNQPYNNSTSGSLITDEIVLFRVVLTVTDGTIRYFFTADSFEVNSYYKILSKNSNTSAVVQCVKNDVGLFSSNARWRLPAFSAVEGYPQTVAFYQNRLFFGKGYIVYGSRSNDFWDFYEPIKLQADDPLTMSLLSQKVNTIRNLITQRSFFTFTAGGEFGIGSEGALTQNDKYLKPFSANGSAPCLPILISDKVLFVDKSYNSVRALQYTLESDGYEAPDITITLRSLLENEKIISTDSVFEEKEALFLSESGTVWVLKYITDQGVLSWSHWKHAFGKITNICVVPHGSYHDIYIAVEHGTNKWIEMLNKNEYLDCVEYFEATDDDKVAVTGLPGEEKTVIQDGKMFKEAIDENGYINAPEDTEKPFKVGSQYVSDGTLLAPIIQASDYSHTNYDVKAPYKVYFYCLDSYGFEVGVNDNEKMPVKWVSADVEPPTEINLTSGKKSVLIPSRFEGTAQVSFVQHEPYPMEIADVLIQNDMGGK